MHYLDIIVLVILLASAVEGGLNGFIYSVCSLLGLAAGFFLALKFCTVLALHLDFIPLPDWVLHVSAFLIILIVVSLIFRLIGKGLRQLMRTLFMGWLDRAAGVLFGLVRGGILICLILMILLLTPMKSIIRREAPQTLFIGPALELVSPFMGTITGNKNALPESV